ncbi:MAG: acyltransferase [Bacteroidales bacterium]|nr:acyltransferase [Rikenellaceae bacterium]MDD6976540.1 acyltransferase [Bacteroidales bacterium]MDY4563296.1 acyltransferase [Candidatus Cryptobacteroides sp.]MDY5319541.1 acyltransferase [Candidatus Egerieousia sp.]MDY6170819.1 acyltransferase [Candidatus Cryptobacteroides sp.]
MKRNTYFDFLRGLAIMMVVGIHTYTLGKDSTVVRQLLNTAVPLFIAISGYCLSQKRMENKDDYLFFLKKKFSKVYLPVLVWSLPLYAIALYSGSSIIKQTILLLSCGLSIYYFVAFIMQCYVVLPVINNYISGNKRRVVIVSCLISFAWIAGVMYMNTIQGKGIPLILYAGPLPCWLMFFVLGVMIGHKPERNYSIILPMVIAILGFILSVIETDYLLDHYGKGVGIKPSSFIYSAGMIFLMFSNKVENLIRRTGAIYRFIIWIGSLSFGIYLVHCYFISFFVKRLPIDSWLLQWSLALFLTVVFILILRKLLPTKYHKYLGI